MDVCMLLSAIERFRHKAVPSSSAEKRRKFLHYVCGEDDVCMTCSGVIELGIKPRRHVGLGGILNAKNK